MADKRGQKRSNNDSDFNPKFKRMKKKVCYLCENKIEDVDYKDTERLKKYVSEKGKIVPKRVTGTCAKHQRKVTNAIKRARHIALMPFTQE